MLAQLLLSLVAVQQPTSPAAPAAPFPIVKVEVQPGGGEVQVGGTLRFTARALDAAGQPVPNAQIGWFVRGDIGKVDSTGLFSGGYQGSARVTAVGYIRAAGFENKQVFGEALVRVLPEPPVRIALEPRPGRVVASRVIRAPIS